jgi:hypothetical protein
MSSKDSLVAACPAPVPLRGGELIGPVCEASAVAREVVSGRSHELWLGGCEWYGPYEVAAVFDVSATAGTKSGLLEGVAVSKNACNVRTREVSVTLE